MVDERLRQKISTNPDPQEKIILLTGARAVFTEFVEATLLKMILF